MTRKRKRLLVVQTGQGRSDARWVTRPAYLQVVDGGQDPQTYVSGPAPAGRVDGADRAGLAGDLGPDLDPPDDEDEPDEDEPDEDELADEDEDEPDEDELADEDEDTEDNQEDLGTCAGTP